MKDKKPERQRKSVPNGAGKFPEGSSGDAKYLRQELSVHQEELKAQNEELRRAEVELTLVRDRYKELFDSAPVGYVTIDGSFMMREANLAAASLLGTHHKDLIGNPLSKFMNREQADAYHLHLMQVRKEGTRQSCELVFCRPDGSLVPGYLETSPYVDNLYGNGWRIVLVDITERKRAEAALSSEERFRLAIGVTHTMVYDLNVRALRVNALHGLRELLGYDDTEAELTLEWWDKQIYPDDLELCHAAFRRMQEGGQEHAIEYRLRHKDGRILHVEDHATAVRDDAGRMVRVIGTVVDITAHKRAEDALRESRAKLEAALNSMTDAVFISDAKGRFIDFNDAFATYHKFKNKDECYKTLAEYPDYVDVYFPDGSLAPLEMWAVPRALRGETASNAEYTILRKDTGETWVGSYSFSPILDKDGLIVGSVVVGRDITELKRAEAALKESERRFRVAQEVSPDGFTILRPVREASNRVIDFTWVYENDTIARLNGTDPKAVVGRKLLDLFPGHRGTTLFTAYQHVAETGESVLIEESYQGETIPTRIWFRIVVVSMGQDIAILAQDITERKRAEDAMKEAKENLELRVHERTIDLQILMKQLEKSRSDLRKLASELVVAEERERKRIAGVLHDEICQTLAVARMRIDMLQGTGLNDESSRYLAEAKEFLVQSIGETRALMNELGNPLLFDMGVAAACESLADRLMTIHPDIRIRCDISDPFKDLDQDVKAVLFQVIRELLNNVIKHSGARNAHVLVHKDDGRIRAEVRDDGMGFDSQKLRAPTNEGGFGLFSIRERLIAFNGDLWIDSTPEAGTVVAASLPFESEKKP